MAYSQELKREMEEAVIPGSLQQVRTECARRAPKMLGSHSLQASRLNPEESDETCDPCMLEVACDEGHCLYQIVDTARRLTPDAQGATLPAYRLTSYFVDVLSLDSNHSRVKLDCGNPGEEEMCVRSVWGLLDADNLARAETHANEVATRDTLVDESEFSPTWTLTASAFFAVGTAENIDAMNFGLRAGLRRWSSLHTIVGIIIEYAHASLTVPPTVSTHGLDSSIVSAQLRFEIASWTRWTAANFGFPEASVYLMAAPALVVTGDNLVGSAKGWRAGIGGHLSNYTGTVAVPLNIEIGFEQFVFRDFQVVGMRFAIGVGI